MLNDALQTYLNIINMFKKMIIDFNYSFLYIHFQVFLFIYTMYNTCY